MPGTSSGTNTEKLLKLTALQVTPGHLVWLYAVFCLVVSLRQSLRSKGCKPQCSRPGIRQWARMQLRLRCSTVVGKSEGEDEDENEVDRLLAMLPWAMPGLKLVILLLP